MRLSSYLRLIGPFLVGLAIVIFCPYVLGQESDSIGLRGGWEQRVLADVTSAEQAEIELVSDEQADRLETGWTKPRRSVREKDYRLESPSRLKKSNRFEGRLASYDQEVAQEIYPADEMVEFDETCGESCGGCGCGFDECSCDSCYINTCYPDFGWLIHHAFLRNFYQKVLCHSTVNLGTEGFKGPVDQASNGNFGFASGINLGLPIGGPRRIGYQLGVQSVTSNYSGDQVMGVRESNRSQVFVTGGFFRKADFHGLQWGVVYDLLHDNYYYNKIDLGQVRAEMSWLRHGTNEWGFSGAFSTQDQEVEFDNEYTRVIEPVSQYKFFYRRHLENGGNVRFWAGFSGNQDGIIGADTSVPLGRSLGLEGGFNYLIPKDGPGHEGQNEEAWSVRLSLVWYIGRDAKCARFDPFQPFMGIGNNGTFMTSFR